MLCKQELIFCYNHSEKQNGVCWFEPLWSLENSKTQPIECSSLET